MRLFLFLFALHIGIFSFSAASAQSIIRDTELEDAVQNWSSEIIRSGGLSPSNVKFIYVQSPQVNAFVAGGANIFIFTGLIDRADSVGELLGVISHELGHITGGHLIRTRQALESASYETILGTIIGIGAAIATGEGGAAGVIGQASSSTATRKFLAHSRINESSADQAALTFMRSAGYDPSGIKTFFQKLQDQELVPASQQVEYVRTHPLTSNRVEAITSRAEQSPYYKKGFPDEWEAEFALLKAKIKAFIAPEQVDWIYSTNDTSLPARYARAIAAYRQNRVEPALSQMDGLIKDFPQNPYFHELKGQMLVDFGRVEQALPSYKRAVSLKPDAALFRIAYAHALIEASRAQNQKAQLDEAVRQLKLAESAERRSPRLHRLLATAYGRQKEDGLAGLHLAEEALLRRDKDYAKQRLDDALTKIKKGTPDWIRAQDLSKILQQG